ncbi:hypothetical protein J4402_05755 [Candidatus Pacearchaeota archaeon]|nr:hypothetical protein [Candidatus Pacearchaeota archaeon]
MVGKEQVLGLFSFVFLFIILSPVLAWEFNGTVYDVDGNALNNTLVNMTIYTMGANGPALALSNSSYSNASGWFNFSVTENVSYMYKPVIRHFNSSNSDLDFIGQSLPAFPYAEFANTTGVNFYLKQAGTINITAINSSGGRTSFNYMVKDTLLGYDVASSWQSSVTEAIVYVPRDRNYSVMVYPQQSLPVSFDWSNFTSSSSYRFGQNLSEYNSTTHVLQKQFNCTEQLTRITGFIQNTSAIGIVGWNEFTVVPYLLEPGDMVFFDQGNLPWNMSSWGQQTDEYNLTTGWYNISLPGPAETANYILFASARNGTKYYGGYMNLSLTYGDSPRNKNFTIYTLMGSNWGALNGNISMHNANDWGQLNISSAQQEFNLINSSGSLITSLTAHLEVKVDYSLYGAKEFTFMKDISSANGTFFLPLLNTTGVKKMSIYSQSFSPKSIPSMSLSGILANPNITMTLFNPGDIGDALSAAQVTVAIYKSNSSCDVPNPPSSCILTASAGMDEFNPLSAIIAGGKISFRMGSGSLQVHYVNVDMLASGPPDAAFENDAGASESSSSFSNAVKFGSGGPTIYDYVLVSTPYSETAGSGLNDSQTVSMSLTTFYGEDSNGDMNWTSPIWISTNGTNASALAGNHSHYSARQTEWQSLMDSSTCATTTTGTSAINSTSPCAIDTANNKIWIRLPHFSGTAPAVSGSIIASATTAVTTSGGSGSAVSSFWTNTFVEDSEELSEKIAITKELGRKNRVRVKINGETHHVGVVELTAATATVNVSSTSQQKTMNIGEEWKVNVNTDEYYDLLIKLNSISSDKANLNIQAIKEIVSAAEEETSINKAGLEMAPEETQKSSKAWLLWIITLAIIVLIVLFIIVKYTKSKRKNK